MVVWVWVLVCSVVGKLVCGVCYGWVGGCIVILEKINGVFVVVIIVISNLCFV